jgi:uncharacterized protein YbaP (TraB family)
MVSISRRAMAAGLFAAGACATVDRRPARVGPPMWKVESGAAQVILFGQFPIPKGIDWLMPEIEQAFARSTEVWFENPDFDPKTASAAMQKRAALGGPKLGEAISSADRQRLAAVLTQANQPPTAFDGCWSGRPTSRCPTSATGSRPWIPHLCRSAY